MYLRILVFRDLNLLSCKYAQIEIFMSRTAKVQASEDLYMQKYQTMQIFNF
jgi:hypothetical protein